MRKSLIHIVGMLSVLQVSAAADTRPTGIAPPTRIPKIEQETPMPAGLPVSTSAIPRNVRRAVVADAAKRFKVAESDVVLTRAEQVTWNDGSMGCAEPGRMYTQALVPGFRVVAKTSGGELAYHTDTRGTVVSCRATAMAPLVDPADSRKGSEPRTGPPARTQPDR
jgi:hypothetical protein